MKAATGADSEIPASLVAPGQVQGGEPGPHVRKILFLTNTSGYGGTERNLIELVLRLDPVREPSTIFCFGKDPYTERLNHLHRRNIPIFSRPRPASFWQWLRMFWQVKPHLAVFIHGGLFVFPWFAYVAARLAGIPRVCSSHHHVAVAAPAPVAGSPLRNVWRRLVGWRVRYLFRLRVPALLSNKVICVSHATRAQLVREYGYPENKAVVIHNGVDFTRFFPARHGHRPVRQSLALESAETVLVFVGRLSPEKGIEVFLQALSKLARENPSWKCIVVGDGPLKEDFSRGLTAMDLASQVFLVGFHADVAPYLQAGDIFVLPSLEEALPLSLLEAMACGLPCVVTDAGGISEVVTHMADGLIVRRGSEDELARALSYLLANPQERQRMAAEALRKVRQRFDLNESMARRKEVLLEENSNRN